MIDLHSHLLPGIDDGAADWKIFERMVDAAAIDHISVIAATSHASERSLQAYTEVFAKAEKIAQAKGVTLIQGMEFDYQILAALPPEQLKTLGDSKFILVDFAQSVIPPGASELFFRLGLSGYRIIIAHPERLFGERIVESVTALNDCGVYYQINSGSLVGRYGRQVRKAAEYLIANGACHLIANDAHRPSAYQFTHLRKLLAERYSSKLLTGWFETNPARILANKEPLTFQPPPSAWRRLLTYFQERVGRTR